MDQFGALSFFIVLSLEEHIKIRIRIKYFIYRKSNEVYIIQMIYYNIINHVIFLLIYYNNNHIIINCRIYNPRCIDIDI